MGRLCYTNVLHWQCLQCYKNNLPWHALWMIWLVMEANWSKLLTKKVLELSGSSAMLWSSFMSIPLPTPTASIAMLFRRALSAAVAVADELEDLPSVMTTAILEMFGLPPLFCIQMIKIDSSFGFESTNIKEYNFLRLTRIPIFSSQSKCLHILLQNQAEQFTIR